MDSKRAIAWLLVMAAIAAAPVAGAQARPMPGDSGNRFGFAVQTDLDFGGDDLATVSFKNGKSQDVKAGQGVTVSAGVHFRPVDTTPFDVQALVGYKYVTTAASNADITVTRVVLQLVGDYQFDNGVYLGGGVVQHSGTRLDGDGFFEELFVCGYLISALKEKRGFAMAVNASAALRISYHLYQGTIGVLTIVPMGLIFAYWYARTGRLWPLIVAHATMNLIALMAYG